MIFAETALQGAYLVDIEPRQDERGFFARTFCRREFEANGLLAAVAQISVASHRYKGTVRGLHFQYPPAAEAKLVRCTRGALLHVIVDLRPESPTYLRQIDVELTEDSHRAVYVPERFAHGCQVLRDRSETVYQMSECYAPELASGLRHDDPRLRVRWPLPITLVGAKDLTWPLLDEIEPSLKQRMRPAADRAPSNLAGQHTHL